MGKKRMVAIIVAALIMVIVVASGGFMLKDTIVEYLVKDYGNRAQIPSRGEASYIPLVPDDLVKAAIIDVIESEEARILLSDVVFEQIQEQSEFRNKLLSEMANSLELQVLLKQQVKEMLRAPETAALLREIVAQQPGDLIRQLLSNKEVKSLIDEAMKGAMKPDLNKP